MKIDNASVTHVNVLGDARSPARELPSALRTWRRKLGYFSILTALPVAFGWYLQETKANSPIAPIPHPLPGETERRQATQVQSYSAPELLRRQSNYLLPSPARKSDAVSTVTNNGDDCPGLVIPAGNYTAGNPFVDVSGTAGANNTVNLLESCYWYCTTLPVPGPDVIYTFTLTSHGDSPEIRVTPTSQTYDPAVYIINPHYQGCPTGPGNTMNYWESYTNNGGPGDAEVLGTEQLNNLPLGVRLYLVVDSTSPGSSGPFTIRMQNTTTMRSGPMQFDFNGDAKSDLSIFRPSDRSWYRDDGPPTQFGLATDRMVPADYDGDRKTDIAMYRDGVWWWIASSDNTAYAAQFGLAGDIPVPADYTGDGRAELAVYRDGVWWTLDLTNGHVGVDQFGLSTDKPVPGDYDGDARTDYAVFRDGIWYLNRSVLGLAAVQWGLPSDQLVPADYDGDGKVDPAVYRNGVWYLLRSSSGSSFYQFGWATDIPVSADYDGDGKADPSLYRNGVWFVRSYWDSTYRLGGANDIPVPFAYVR